MSADLVVERPHRLRRLRKVLLYLGTLVVTTAAVIVPAAAPAAADVCTSHPGCGGRLFNHSTWSVMVTNCWSGYSTYQGFYPPCTTNYNPYAYDSWMFIPTNGTTDNYFYYWDTDGFQAPGGCVTWWWIEGMGVSYYTDRTGTSALWQKFNSYSVVHVGAVWC